MGKHTLIIEGDDLNDLADQLLDATNRLTAGAQDTTAAPAASEAVKSPAKTAAKKKPAAAVEPVAVVEATEPTESETESEEDLLGGGAAEATEEDLQETAPPTLEDVQDALKSVVKDKVNGGVEKAKGILAKFKAPKTTDLKTKDYGAFVAACKKLVK